MPDKFLAHFLDVDDTYSTVDCGGSFSQIAASRMALQLCNNQKRDTCVVRHDRNGDPQEIVERIRWKGLAVSETPQQSMTELHLHAKYLSQASLEEALEFARRWAGDLWTVTISVAAGSENMRYNVVARR